MGLHFPIRGRGTSAKTSGGGGGGVGGLSQDGKTREMCREVENQDTVRKENGLRWAKKDRPASISLGGKERQRISWVAVANRTRFLAMGRGGDARNVLRRTGRQTALW